VKHLEWGAGGSVERFTLKGVVILAINEMIRTREAL
jgi:hypothetical protein